MSGRRLDEKRVAFETAAIPHMRALYNTALRLVQEPPDAADLVQETYLRAYRTFDNFVRGTNSKAWLFTILYSVFVNQYHQAKRRRMESVEDLEARFHQFPNPPDDGSSDVALVDGWGKRWNPEVERALRRLPEDFRSPLLLVDVEGMSYEEAAAVLGCAVGTIGSRLFRGRKLLFAMLRDFAHQAGYGKDASSPT